MINTCDPNVAAWAEDGLTFVVKDTEKFQNDFIPKYFKHNNFSSFVRQLNFYGFRKVRSDPVLLKDAETSEESKYWRFHHHNFKRGRPDLLTEIRKTSQNESADKQEVEVLKNEVSSLKRTIADMTTDMEGLKALVGNLLQNQKVAEFRALNVAPTKKRRLSNEALAPIPSHCTVHSQPMHPSYPTSADAVFSNSTEPRPMLPPKRTTRNESVGAASFTSQDEAMLTSLFALDPLDDIEILESAEGVSSANSMMSTPSSIV